MTSTAIYTCYRQLHPPTGVDHAVFGSIISPGSRDLVVAKASILELYKVHRQPSADSSSSSGKKDVRDTSQPAAPRSAANTAAARKTLGTDTRTDSDSRVDGDGDDEASIFFLELAGTFPLAGNISSLSVIPVASASVSASDKCGRSGEASSRGAAGGQEQQPQDILVVCFGTAQMALVAYDEGLGRLATLSIHNFDAGVVCVHFLAVMSHRLAGCWE